MKASLHRPGTLIVSFIALAGTLGGCGEGVPACEETRTCQPDDSDADETDTGLGGGNDTGSDDDTDDDDSSTSGDGDDDDTSSGDGDEPSSCADGTWDHDGDPDTKCKDWSTCEPGQYVSEEGTPTSDRECAQCEEGTFSEDDDAEECSAWTECPSGIVAVGTSTSDAVCASPAVDVAVGDGFSCILREDGTVACWGKNDVGQLGQGHTNHSPLPQPVMVEGQDIEPLEGVVQLSVGQASACALRENGTVWCWGSNSRGQANLERSDEVLPLAQQIESVASATKVASGGEQACAILVDESTACWGNTQGGYRTGAPSWFDADVTAREIGVGDEFVCVVEADESAVCWGFDTSGGIGWDIYPYNWGEPALIEAPKNVEAVSVSSGRTCWLLENHKAACRGNLLSYVDDTLIQIQTPEGLAVIQVEARQNGVCVLLDDGTVWCQEGDETGALDASVNALVQVDGLENIVAIDAGYSHACAVDDEGRVYCWGKNENGELGDNTIFQSTKPLLVPNLERATALTSGSDHTCALLDNGKVKCWGANDEGQLGIGSNEPMGGPLQLGISEVIDIRSKYDLTYAVKSDHSLRMWGSGYAVTSPESTVQNVSDPTDVERIATGYNHACAIKTDQTLTCWGVNYYGSLGTNEGMSANPVPPLEVADVSDVVDVAGGHGHTCALSNGEVTCWGLNDFGQVGLNDSFYSGAHFLMPNLTGVTQLALGRSFSMALLEDGSIAAWGRNRDGELGDGTNLDTRDLVDFVKVEGLTQAVKVAAGIDHACAVLADGGVTCWGKNDQGQAGVDSELQLNTPHAVPSLSSVANVSAGLAHTCALHENGTVSCWGTNESFQLGRVRVNHSTVPQEVIWQ